MGLDKDFLSMLEGRVVLERVTGKDKWGNETYAAPTTEHAYVGSGTSSYGGGSQGKQQERQAVMEADLLMDGIGVKVGDRITYDSVVHTVVSVTTEKDQFGADLIQNVTVQDEKKG